jgi:hypothetical protein
MVLDKNLTAGLATGIAVGLGATLTLAEGLERANLDTSFMFSEGTVAEFGMGRVTPSLPATRAAFGLDSDSVAKSFTVTTFSTKMDIGDGISAGIWYTNNGNGVSLDYGTLTAPFTGDTGTIAADLNMPSLAALVTYDINDNFSLIGGFKRVTVPGGASVKTFNNTDNDNTLGADTGIGGAEDLPDATSTWTLSDTSAAGAVYGLSYARSDIALRVTMLVESAIDLSIDTTGTGGVAASGTSTASVGDAVSFAFQTGIAENTLLYGNYRISKWKDNQVSVPTVVGLAQLSDFDDGDSWSLGVARRINDSLAVSVSYFSDPGDGNDASELSPTGGNRAITAGAKVGVMDNADLTLGATWSQRGDATTANLGAALNKSIVTTLGAKLSYKF